MAGEETKNWKFHHLGVIVGDMEKAVAYYRSLGFIDIFPETPGTGSSPGWVELTAYGKTVIKDGKFLVPVKPAVKGVPNTWCRIGSMTLELIQPAESSYKNVNRDFLEKFGEGINHIAYTVDGEHFVEEVEKMKARGLEIILSGRQASGRGFFYFDTRKSGGIMTELMWGPSRV